MPNTSRRVDLRQVPLDRLALATLCPELAGKDVRRVERLAADLFPAELQQPAREQYARTFRREHSRALAAQPHLAGMPRHEPTKKEKQRALSAAQKAADNWLQVTVGALGQMTPEHLRLLGADDDDMRDAARRYAEINSQIIDRMQAAGKAQELEDFADSPRQLYQVAPGFDTDAKLGRLCSPKWWRRRIRREIRGKQEQLARLLGLVGHGRCKYVSGHTLEQYKQQLKVQEEWLASHCVAAEITDPSGMQRTVSIPLDKIAAAAPGRRYAEIKARAAGIAEIADRHGMQPAMVTVTMAGYHHAVSEEWDRSTTAELLDWQKEQWSRLRARAAKAGIKLIGAWAAEPHKDGTPHWHHVVWTDDPDAVRALFEEYYLEADRPDEPGARRRRVVWEAAKCGNGGAINYLLKYALKYVAKGDSGTAQAMREKNMADYERNADAVRAWRSTHRKRALGWYACNIEQARISTYRELRRVKDPAKAQAAHRPHAVASQRGDWSAFCDAHAAHPVRLDYRTDTNTYGEPTKKISGVRSVGGAGVTATRHIRWEIKEIQKSPNCPVTLIPNMPRGGAGAPRFYRATAAQAPLSPRWAPKKPGAPPSDGGKTTGNPAKGSAAADFSDVPWDDAPRDLGF